jgi:hypothetical protein
MWRAAARLGYTSPRYIYSNRESILMMLKRTIPDIARASLNLVKELQ